MPPRRFVAAALILSAGVVVAVGAAAGLREDQSSGKPKLRVVSTSPFGVVGTGFRSGEMVRITVRAKSSVASGRNRARPSGRIEMRFRGVKLGRCPEYVVAARGDKGSVAGLRSAPQPCGALP